ncbi:MAG TPA: anti-sigma factor [Gammaproteobacteria bacterium]|nr:anti-sigma factor [Gammaproteobacteria bacterium]
MTCQELENQLHPYLDGELDAAEQADVEQHLEGCPDCQARLKDWRALHGALQAPELRFKASGTLRQRLQNELHKPQAARRHWERWAAAAAVAIVAVALGFKFIPHGDEDDAMVDSAVDQQEQAATSQHLTEFSSTNPALIQGWLSHQLPFVPPVSDLSAQGYALVGVRVDKVKGQPAAALTYRHGAGLITLFICEAQGKPDKDPDTDTDDDYHVVYWTKAHYSFWTVSTLGADDLKRFGTLLRAAG